MSITEVWIDRCLWVTGKKSTWKCTRSPRHVISTLTTCFNRALYCLFGWLDWSRLRTTSLVLLSTISVSLYFPVDWKRTQWLAALFSILGGAKNAWDEWKSQPAGCQKGIAACGADIKHMETHLTPGKRRVSLQGQHFTTTNVLQTRFYDIRHVHVRWRNTTVHF